MRLIALVLSFCSTLAFAAPSVQSSQFTAFNSTNAPAVAIQSGAVGDRIYVLVAFPFTVSATKPAGWTQFLSQSGTIGIMRTSDGTETSVSVSLNQSTSGQAVAIRVAGPVFPIPYIGSVVTGTSDGPDAGPGPANPLPSVPFLHLTFAVAFVPSATPVLAPSGYSNIISAANGVGLMVAEKSDNGGAVEDAGAWLLSASSQWRAQTFSTR